MKKEHIHFVALQRASLLIGALLCLAVVSALAMMIIAPALSGAMRMPVRCSSIYEFGRNGPDRDELRDRLRRMPDQELLRFGIMCSVRANCGNFGLQLEEARTEWKRRNPELPLSISF